MRGWGAAGPRSGVPAPAGRDRGDGTGHLGGRGRHAHADTSLQSPLVPLVPLVAGARAGGRLRPGHTIPGNADARVASPLSRPLALAGPPADDTPVVHGTVDSPIFGPDSSAGLCRSPRPGVYAIFFGFGASITGSTTGPVASAASGGSPCDPLLVVFPVGMGVKEGWPGPLGVGPDSLAPGPSPSSCRRPTLAHDVRPHGVIPAVLPSREPEDAIPVGLGLLALPRAPAAGHRRPVRGAGLAAAGPREFLLIIAVVTAFLLWTYQTLVRYTWLGRFLNGPPVRPARSRATAAVA